MTVLIVLLAVAGVGGGAWWWFQQTATGLKLPDSRDKVAEKQALAKLAHVGVVVLSLISIVLLGSGGVSAVRSHNPDVGIVWLAIIGLLAATPGLAVPLLGHVCAGLWTGPRSGRLVTGFYGFSGFAIPLAAIYSAGHLSHFAEGMGLTADVFGLPIAWLIPLFLEGVTVGLLAGGMVIKGQLETMIPQAQANLQGEVAAALKVQRIEIDAGLVALRGERELAKLTVEAGDLKREAKQRAATEKLKAKASKAAIKTQAAEAAELELELARLESGIELDERRHLVEGRRAAIGAGNPPVSVDDDTAVFATAPIDPKELAPSNGGARRNGHNGIGARR